MNSAIQMTLLGLIMGLGATISTGCDDDCECPDATIRGGTFQFDSQNGSEEFPDMSGGTLVVSEESMTWSYSGTVIEFVKAPEETEGVGGMGGHPE